MNFWNLDPAYSIPILVITWPNSYSNILYIMGQDFLYPPLIKTIEFIREKFLWTISEAICVQKCYRRKWFGVLWLEILECGAENVFFVEETSCIQCPLPPSSIPGPSNVAWAAWCARDQVDETAARNITKTTAGHWLQPNVVQPSFLYFLQQTIKLLTFAGNVQNTWMTDWNGFRREQRIYYEYMGKGRC